MKNLNQLFSLLSVLLIISWSVFFFGYHTNNLVHLLLVLAGAFSMLAIVSRKKMIS